MKKEILIIEQYKNLPENNSIAILFKQKGYNIRFFHMSKGGIPFMNKIQLVKREISSLFRLLFHINILINTKTLCLGGHYSTLLISRLFSVFLGRKHCVYLYNFYIHSIGEKKVIRKILHFLLNNKKIVLIVQSPSEVDFYKSLTAVKIHFVPYCADIRHTQIHPPALFPDKPYIFTGGYTNRDYHSVIQCAMSLPEHLFVIVASSLNKEIKYNNIPQNIIIFKDIPNAQFEYLLAKANIVIVPLLYDVGASGQMLSIGAMKNKKPIVYCNVSSINYYFESNSGIPYEIGDEESMMNAISLLLNNQSLCTQIGNNSYMKFLNSFTIEIRDNLLYEIIDK